MATMDSPLPVYSVVSASHRRLNEEFFLPSLMSTASGKVKVRQYESPQTAAHGRFRETGWQLQTRAKIEWMLQAAVEEATFVFTDVDVVFLRPWLSVARKALEKADLCHMIEPTFCPAFMVLRSTPALRQMLESILQDWGRWPGDGSALKEQIPRFGIRRAALAKTFSNPGLLGFPIPIQGGDITFTIPSDTRVFHGNFCDISQKPFLLEKVLRQAADHLSEKASEQQRSRSWWRKLTAKPAQAAPPSKPVCEPGKFPPQRPNRPFDRQSMMSRANFRDLLNLVGDHPVSLIVEIGSWLGSSTRWFLETFGSAIHSGEEHPYAEVISIDPWTGLVEHEESTELACRIPHLWEQWCANCWEWRHCITPVRLPSSTGIPAIAAELDRQKRTPDLIFVDGDHNEAPCYEDIRLSNHHWPGSLMLGDDYYLELPEKSGQYPVKRAVDRASRDFGRELTVGGSGIWRLMPLKTPISNSTSTKNTQTL